MKPLIKHQYKDQVWYDPVWYSQSQVRYSHGKAKEVVARVETSEPLGKAVDRKEDRSRSISPRDRRSLRD